METRNEIKFKKLSEIEFSNLKRSAEIIQFSPFAEFCQQCKGLDFYNRSGVKFDRWEVWAMGLRSVELIKKGFTKIIAQPKSCLSALLFFIILFTSCERFITDGTYTTTAYYNNGELIENVAIELTITGSNFFFCDPATEITASGSCGFTDDTFTMDWGETVSVWQYEFQGNKLILTNDYERWELLKN